MLSDKYRQMCQLYYEEILRTLTTENKVEMSKIVSSLGTASLREKEKSLRKEVFLYLESTPAQRSKMKKWNGEDSLLLKFFALKYLLDGYKLLRVVRDLPAGGGYRSLIAIYSVASAQMKDEKIHVELNYFPSDLFI